MQFTINTRRVRMPDGNYICSTCHGRLVRRGCSIGAGSVPVWADQPERLGVCVGCGKR